MTKVRTTMMLAGLAIAASPAVAQLNGVPVWPVGLPDPLGPPLDLIGAIHTTSGGDFVSSASAADPGATIAVQYRASEFLILRGLAGVTVRDVSATKRKTMGQAGILGGVTIASWPIGTDGDNEAGFSLVTAYGYSGIPEGSEENVLLGVDFTGVFAMGGWFIEPSIVPRYAFRRMELQSVGDWQSGPAVSAAVTVGFPWGLRLQIAGERIFLGAGEVTPPGLPRTRTYLWSFAALWRL